jgi:hypothetical protein
MRLKAFKLFFLALLIAGVFNRLPSTALNPTDSTSEQYLLNHGHSEELIRMINLQKERTEGNATVSSQSENKFKKFFKNLWFEQDLTLPVTDFGYNNIKSVETDKNLFSKDLTEPVKDHVYTPIKDFVKKDKKNAKPDEININDVKVREAE